MAVARTLTELPRPDVQVAFSDLGPNAGFALSFPLGAEQSEVCVEAIDPLDGGRTPLGCRTVGAAIEEPDDDDTTRPTAEGEPAQAELVVWGELDDIEISGTIAVLAGWACMPNEPDSELVVTARSTAGAVFNATPDQDHARPSALGIDTPCGFAIEADFGSGTHEVQLVAGPEGANPQVLTTTTIEIP